MIRDERKRTVQAAYDTLGPRFGEWGERIDPDAYRRILEAGSEAMRPFVVDGGRVELPIQGHLVTVAKAG